MHHRGTFQTACVLIAAALLLTGCAGHTKKSDAMLESYRVGDMISANAHAAALVEDSGDKDELIWLLEAGAVARTSGDYELSNTYLDRADEIFTEYEEAAKTSVTQEAKATITHQAELPYRGRTYDGVMMNTYKALNYLALGNLDAARVELNRAYQRQRDAVDANAKRIEKAKEEASEEGYDVEKAQEDPQFAGDLAEAYGELEQEAAAEEYAAYANYVNPLAEFVQALYFMAAGLDGSDLERARMSMGRVAGMAKFNPYLAEDITLSEDAASGTPLPPLTYVVFETGTGPHRKTIRIDIPLFVLGKYSGGVDYVGAAFPNLDVNDNYIHGLEIQTPDGNASTTTLASMDKIIRQEFKNELPTVITKTLVSTAVKATAAWGLNKATESNAVLNIATRIGTGAYQVTMNQADERTWRTLPKQFEYCRFYTPDNGSIDIYDRNTGSAHPVTLDPEKVNVVWVRSTSITAPLQVSHFTLP